VHDPIPIQNFWLMQILGKFGAKQNLYFMFSFPPVQKTFRRYLLLLFFSLDPDPFFSIPETQCGSEITQNRLLRLPLNEETQTYEPDYVSIPQCVSKVVSRTGGDRMLLGMHDFNFAKI